MFGLETLVNVNKSKVVKEYWDALEEGKTELATKIRESNPDVFDLIMKKEI